MTTPRASQLTAPYANGLLYALHFATRGRERVETDGELLARFVARRDEKAFAELVRRHGPMVHGACRRVLGNVHDAEDAYQATFLVLARKAAAIRSGQVGNWLYGVACRTARKARSMAAAQRVRERAGARPEEVRPDGRAELREVLDRELERLPDKYRSAIVLCDLEGQSYKDAARQLGWPEGTLSGRLARGRALLARRLVRRGLELCGGVAALTGSDAVAGLPVAATVEAALGFVSGRSVRAASAVALANGVLNAMTLNTIKVVWGVVLVASLLTAGVGLAVRAPSAEDDVETPPPPAAEQAAGTAVPPADAAKVEYALRCEIAKPGAPFISRVAFSPDGKRLALAEWRSETTAYPGPDGLPRTQTVVNSQVSVWNVEKGTAGFVVGRRYDLDRRSDAVVRQLEFSPDGRLLAINYRSSDPNSADQTAEVVDAATGRVSDVLGRKKLTGPTREVIPNAVHSPGLITFSPNGEWLVAGFTQAYQPDENGPGRLRPVVRLFSTADFGDMSEHYGPWSGLAPAPPDHVAFSSGSHTVVVSFAGVAVRFDEQESTWNGRFVRPLPNGVHNLVLGPDGHTLASAVKMGGGWSLYFRDPRGLKLPPFAAAFSRDGRRIVTMLGREDGRALVRIEIGIWDVASREKLTALALGDFVAADAALSADGQTLAVAGAGKNGGQVQLWTQLSDLPRSSPPALPPIVVERDVVRMSRRELHIPVRVAPERQPELKEVNLFASTDQGKSWQLAAKLLPDQRYFHYTAPADGLYWFAIQLVKKDGTVEPRDLAGQPPLKVLVQESGASQEKSSPPAAQPKPLPLPPMLLDHRTVATVNLVRAIEAKRDGDDAKTRRLLEAAHKLDPEEPQIGNNLAWMLAMGPDPDLPRAEKLINAVLERYPDHATCRATRGQILMRMKGRTEEARRDLEYAKRMIAPNRDTYTALAQVYRALGLTREADEHEKKAASLTSN